MATGLFAQLGKALSYKGVTSKVLRHELSKKIKRGGFFEKKAISAISRSTKDNLTKYGIAGALTGSAYSITDEDTGLFEGAIKGAIAGAGLGSAMAIKGGRMLPELAGKAHAHLKKIKTFKNVVREALREGRATRESSIIRRQNRKSGQVESARARLRILHNKRNARRDMNQRNTTQVDRTSVPKATSKKRKRRERVVAKNGNRVKGTKGGKTTRERRDIRSKNRNYYGGG